MTPEETLDAAAEYINQHGWCKDRLEDDEGRVCIQGAIVRVSLAANQCVAHEAVERALPDLAAPLHLYDITAYPSVSFWNDTQCRDADEAIHMLKKAKEFL